MNDAFYKNVAADQYNLVIPKMEQLEQLEPRNMKTGYDITEIVSYLVFYMQELFKMNNGNYA